MHIGMFVKPTVPGRRVIFSITSTERCRNAPLSCCADPKESPKSKRDALVERQKRIKDKVLTPLDTGIHFCVICATGDSKVLCPRCDGTGEILTRPGGAGVPGQVGVARCKLCGGSGIVPCVVCGGYH